MITSSGRWIGGLVVIAALFPASARAQPDVASSLSVSGRSSITGAPETQISSARTVAQIRGADPLWNGALIGAAIGAGLALWDYLIDPSEPGNAAITVTAVGLGFAIGAGIDALLNKGGRVVSASPGGAVTVSPLLWKNRQGMLVAVRF